MSKFSISLVKTMNLLHTIACRLTLLTMSRSFLTFKGLKLETTMIVIKWFQLVRHSIRTTTFQAVRASGVFPPALRVPAQTQGPQRSADQFRRARVASHFPNPHRLLVFDDG